MTIIELTCKCGQSGTFNGDLDHLVVHCDRCNLDLLELHDGSTFMKDCHRSVWRSGSPDEVTGRLALPDMRKM